MQGDAKRKKTPFGKLYYDQRILIKEYISRITAIVLFD